MFIRLFVSFKDLVILIPIQMAVFMTNLCALSNKVILQISNSFPCLNSPHYKNVNKHTTRTFSSDCTMSIFEFVEVMVF